MASKAAYNPLAVITGLCFARQSICLCVQFESRNARAPGQRLFWSPMLPFRNIGIIAHVDAGKTTFTERLLYYADTIRRMGEVHEGSATMDFLPEEQERGITIAAACTTANWLGMQINIIDTPGHVDFSIEVERSLRVLDGAVGIFCGVSGVEPQSEQVWRQSERYAIPKLAVVNKLDMEGAEYGAVLLAMAERLGATPLPVTVPLGQGKDFRAVLDLVHEEMLLFQEASQGKTVERLPFDAMARKATAPYLEHFVNILTRDDEELTEIYLSGERPTAAQLHHAIRKGTMQRTFVPVFAAAAFRNMGIQPVMDGICQYLPGPNVHKAEGVLMGTSGAALPTRTQPEMDKNCLCAFVFKVIQIKGIKTAFVRVYAGRVQPGDQVFLVRTTNTATPKKETVAGLFRVFASSLEPLDCAETGDIVALTGLQQALTGDTLASGPPFVPQDPVPVMPPVLSLAFEPRDEDEGIRLDAALAQVAEEDPTLLVEMRGGERLVSGMGELHLEVVKNRLEREFSLFPRVGHPHAVLWETPASPTEADNLFRRILGNDAHFGFVRVRVEPVFAQSGQAGTLPAGDSPEETCAMPEVLFAPAVGGASRWLLEAVQDGVLAACSAGPKGHPLRYLRITVQDLTFDGAEASTVLGSHLAARSATIQALEKGKTAVLEPFMAMVVTTPDTCMGAVMDLLHSCTAKVEEIRDSHGLKEIRARAPMQKLFGFATRLRSASQGRAGVSMRFSAFAIQKL